MSETLEKNYDPHAVVKKAVLKRIEENLALTPDDEKSRQTRDLLTELRQESARGLGVHFKPGDDTLDRGNFFVGTDAQSGRLGPAELAPESIQIHREEAGLQKELSFVNNQLVGDTSYTLARQLQQEHPMEINVFLKDEVAREIRMVNAWLEQVNRALKADQDLEAKLGLAYKPAQLEKWLARLREFEQQLQ